MPCSGSQEIQPPHVIGFVVECDAHSDFERHVSTGVFAFAHLGIIEILFTVANGMLVFAADAGSNCGPPRFRRETLEIAYHRTGGSRQRNAEQRNHSVRCFGEFRCGCSPGGLRNNALPVFTTAMDAPLYADC